VLKILFDFNVELEIVDALAHGEPAHTKNVRQVQDYNDELEYFEDV
jgi:hypothetical protein